jgi:predicted SAM-dependent methyltransferase
MTPRSSLAVRVVREVYRRTPPRLNPVLQARQAPTYRRLRAPDRPLRLHLGCGSQRFEGFINIDLKPTSATDYVAHIGKLPCPTDSVDRIETYHVIEHIPHPEAPDTLREWYRVLMPGGTLIIECPEMDEAVRRYLAGDERMLATLYGWQRYPGDTHFYGYNVTRLAALLREVGFATIAEAPPQDYHAELEPCMRLEATK